MNESIGDRIKRRREKAGLKQKELAEKLHVTNKTVCQWEKTSNIPLDKIVLLADFFNVSLDWLIKGTGTENLSFSNKTGLSEKTIEVLNATPKDDSILSTFYAGKIIAGSINYLVENDCGFLIVDIADFIDGTVTNRKNKNDLDLIERVDYSILGTLIGQIMKARDIINLRM